MASETTPLTLSPSLQRYAEQETRNRNIRRALIAVLSLIGACLFVVYVGEPLFLGGHDDAVAEGVPVTTGTGSDE
ncbi:hypothetical protein PHYPSEUDO_003031, partial [Phytophthora pseudosyringae]